MQFEVEALRVSSFGNLLHQPQLQLKGSKYCIYSGDVNQDGTVDITDMVLIDNDSYNFAGGYLSTDVTGDGTVDITDMVIVDNNSYKFVGKVVPQAKSKAKPKVIGQTANQTVKITNVVK